MVRTGISGSQTVAAMSQALLGCVRADWFTSAMRYQVAPGCSRASTCISARR